MAIHLITPSAAGDIVSDTASSSGHGGEGGEDVQAEAHSHDFLPEMENLGL